MKKSPNKVVNLHFECRNKGNRNSVLVVNQEG